MSEAKRKLSDFDFSKEGAHVALVDKAANGHEVLVMKSVEDVEKAEVQVKMDIVDFLKNFFNMWTGEAATLAAILGFEQDWFDEDFTFEEFNSLGATEVTLLKSASAIDKTEVSLGEFVSNLPSGDRDILKAYAEGFNKQLKDHKMTEEVKKAEELQTDLTKALADNEAMKTKLADIEKAKVEANKTKYVDLAKSLGGEEDLGVAMAVVSMSDQGLTVIKALEDAHKRLEEFVEKEAGFNGEQNEDTSSAETSIMKAMKDKYEDK